MKTIKVWDPLVRTTHWALVCCVLGNYAFNEAGEIWHEWMGYTATGIVLVRIIWGFVGTKHARFTEFFPTRSRLIPYVKLLLRGKEPRTIGHNPVGALMMLTLMLMVCFLGLTGYLMGTDTFWGDETIKGVHAVLANSLITLVALHVVAAVIESLRHRENLILAMITGKKKRE